MFNIYVAIVSAFTDILEPAQGIIHLCRHLYSFPAFLPS